MSCIVVGSGLVGRGWAGLSSGDVFLPKTRKWDNGGVKEPRQESATSLRSGGVASDTVSPKRELGKFPVTQWGVNSAVQSILSSGEFFSFHSREPLVLYRTISCVDTFGVNVEVRNGQMSYEDLAHC